MVMDKHKHTRILFTFCTFLILYGATILNNSFALESCQFPVIFNFGASNSDTGGFAAAFIQPKSPNGDTFFGMPVGRFADGRLIIDFTAESLDLPLLSSYLNSLASNFSHGANFATLASTIRLPAESIIPRGRSSPFYLRLQYLQFAQFKVRSQLIRRQGGVYASLMPREEYFAKALYTFDICQNDLTQGLFLNMTVTEVIVTVPDIVNQFTDNIKDFNFLLWLVVAMEACGETLSVNGTNIVVGSCKDPSVRVNWDGTHFTDAANKFAFDRVSTGAFSDPPIPLKLACHPQ